MNNKEKKFVLVLLLIGIIIVLLEQLYLYKANSNEYMSQIEYYSKIVGTSDVNGEGITIAINDGSDLVHQEDLIILIDELKNSGAEAISINDQRITYSSYLYCDGGVILIDGQKIGNPFFIKAIGNSSTMYSSMTRNKGYIATLIKDGLQVNVQKVDSLIINKTGKNRIKNSSFDKLSNLSQLNLLKRISGATDIIGSGVEIKISITNNSDISALNLLQLINDLNSANVDAISINGNRIVANTDIMDINKEYIIINSIPIASPYIIKVIGNVKDINQVVNYTNSALNKIKANGKNVTMENKLIIKIDKYNHQRAKDKLDLQYITN